MIKQFWIVLAVTVSLGSISQQALANKDTSFDNLLPQTATVPAPDAESEILAPIQLTEDTPAPDPPANSFEPAAAAPDAEPYRRGLPAPIDSPPFPSSEWQIGGTTPIGVPDTDPTFALMNALNKGPFADILKKSRIKISGWVNVGGNISTSTNSNFPVSYSVFANRVDLDQLVLRIERKPDTVQTDHVDWGFHVDNLYGIDYRFTTSKGIFSNQLLQKNRQYGYDPLLFYGDIYIPKIAKGMNIRFGRFLSLPDIEAQLAPENYMYTHSLLYTFDPYTQMGVVTTTKLSDQWQIQLGLTGGNDVALWAGSRHTKPTGLALLWWTSKSNNDSLYGGVNAINDGEFGYNNVQQFVATWSHRFNRTVHTKTEGYFMYQRNVPDIGFAPVWSVVNYLQVKLSPKSYLSIRNEVYDDVKGQRTGFNSIYTSHAVGISYWINKSLGFRPEIRFDNAYNTSAYNNGTKRAQLLGAMDMILRF